MDSPTFEETLHADVNNNMNINSIWHDENFRKLRHCRVNAGKTMQDVQKCREYLQQWSANFWRIENEIDDNLNFETFAKNKKKLERVLQEHSLGPSQVYYLDEVLLRLMVPKNGKMEKGDLIRVILCTNMLGDHKLPLSILGRFDPTPCTTLPLHYCSQNLEWSLSVFETWFSTFFVTQVSFFLLKNNLPPKAVLITFRPRSVYEVEHGNFWSMYLPPGKSPMGDPLYKDLKSVYERNIQILVGEKDPTVENSAMYDVVRAWDNLKSQDIRKVFAKVFDIENGKVIMKKGQKGGKSFSLQAISENDTNDIEIDVDTTNDVENCKADSPPRITENNDQSENNDQYTPDYKDVPQRITEHEANKSMKNVMSYFEQSTGPDSVEYLILKIMNQTINENPRKRKSSYTTENASKRRHN